LHHIATKSTALLLVIICFAGCGGGGGGGGKKPPPPVNVRPNAIITVDSATGHAPFTVSFDATQSNDSDGTISSYSWDFGDGSNAQTSQASHTYSDLDTFSAVLTITDNDGATSTATTSIRVHAQVAGYYFGSIWSDVTFARVDIEVIVGTNLEVQVWDYINYDSGYWGNYDISEAIISGTINAEIRNPALTFVDGTQLGTIALSADVTANQSIIGTYSGVGDTGPIEVSYVPEISDVPLTFTEMSGTWTYADGLGYSESMTVAADGTISYSASDGCTASGQISELDAAINIYEFEYDLSCPGGVTSSPNGVRAGLAFVDDHWSADTWLVLAGSIGNSGTQLALSRPRSVPLVAAKLSNASEAKQTNYSPPRHRNLLAR
jgi:PKD repeat protein